MAENERAAVVAALREASRLVVVTHENPDGDALGSLIAMQRILAELGKDCLMYIDRREFPLPHEYRFFPLDGHISKPPADLGERVLVFLDCGNIDRNPVAEAFSGAGAQVLNIDHHHDNTRFGTLNLVDDEASCTAEIVWMLAAEFGVPLTRTVAEALYVGLITDTGRFMYENTTPRAHQMAGELIEAGVDVHAMYRRVYEGMPYGKLTLLARGLTNVRRYDGGRLTMTLLDSDDFEASEAEESYSEGVVDYLRAVQGTAVAALVRDRLGAGGGDGHDDILRKVSLRATDERVDVSAIAREQGGGGHRQAAGFTTTMDWDSLVAFLRDELARQLN